MSCFMNILIGNKQHFDTHGKDSEYTYVDMFQDQHQYACAAIRAWKYEIELSNRVLGKSFKCHSSIRKHQAKIMSNWHESRLQKDEHI